MQSQLQYLKNFLYSLVYIQPKKEVPMKSDCRCFYELSGHYVKVSPLHNFSF